MQLDSPDAPSVRVSVSADPRSGEIVYQYAIAPNTGGASVLGAQLVRVPSFGIEIEGPPGWVKEPFITVTHAAGLNPALSVAAGNSARIEVRSRYLPGVAELRIYPAVVPSAWDAPVWHWSQPVIGPVIMSASDDPARASADILEQLPFLVLAPLIAERDASAVAMRSSVQRVRTLIQRGDLSTASLELDLLLNSVPSDPTPGRRELYAALSFDLRSVKALLTAAGSRIEPIAQDLALGSSWVTWSFPGAIAAPPIDLAAFARESDGIFLGTLEEVASELVDGNEIRSRYRFRITEALQGPVPRIGEDLVDVWVRGGTVTTSGGQTQLQGPLLVQPDPARQMFVAVNQISRPGSPFDGQFYLRHPDTLVHFLEGRVEPAVIGATWSGEVVRSARRSLAFEPAWSDADVFAESVRRATQSRP